MPLSLTTRRRQQTSTAKWSSSQQHLSQHQDLSSVAQHSLRHHNHHMQQPVRKQRSFIEPSHLNNSRLSAYTGRNYLSRGLSVGRSHDIQRSFPKQVPKKYNSNNSHTEDGKSDRNSLKSEDLIKKNIAACGQSSELLRNSRRLQAWSSTSSILKSLDKELAQLNGVVGKCKDVKADIESVDYVETTKIIKTKTDSVISISSHGSQITKKSTKPEPNKVNLSIVLSHALNASREENDCVLSEQDDDSDDISTDSGKVINLSAKHKENKKTEIVTKSTVIPSNPVPAQQRRALYHTNRLSSNFTLTSTNANTNSVAATITGIQNPQNFNVSPSLTVQKRPPLVRAMSAPVRSFDESTKGSFLGSKRKSRRRKLNTRQISCIDKTADEPLKTKDFNFDSNPVNNKKVLTRSKSVAPDVITLVSLISSEGSDSEKEDFSTTPSNSDTSSPTRRAPSLRKTGKSVSFQENYPPTFQFASKEYSHMLRRGSIAPLAQRIKSNRPPTAPPGSIFHTSNKLNTEMNDTKDKLQEKESPIENINTLTSSSTTASSQNNINKALEEEYEFPEYVRSLKERECWKLFMKMSTKGVNITYDTILRGMLTPTEFRQLQKQRDIEEAKEKSLKETEESTINEEKPKGPTTAIERLSESLLKN